MSAGIDAVEGINGLLLGADVHHGTILQDEVYVASEVDGPAVVQRAVGHIPSFGEFGLVAREDGVLHTFLRDAPFVEVGHGDAGHRPQRLAEESRDVGDWAAFEV